MSDRKLRILVAKPGLDGHDRGAKVVARALADAGYEVVYTGLHQTPEMIAAAAVQEAVDAVGLSIMSGAHMTLFPAVIEALKQRGVSDVTVFGGIVPKDDLPKLAAIGVAKISRGAARTNHRVVETYLRRGRLMRGWALLALAACSGRSDADAGESAAPRCAVAIPSTRRGDQEAKLAAIQRR